MVQEPTIKIRRIGLTLDPDMGPLTMYVTPRTQATFDVDGTAMVPRSVASILLGGGHKGEYELVREPKPEPKQEETEKVQALPTKTLKGIKSKKEPELTKEEIEFAKSIVE